MRIAALGHLGSIGLGSMTQAEIDQANQQLEKLQIAMSRPNDIVDQARRTGLDESFVTAISSTRAALFGRLQELADQIPSLSSQGLQTWLSRARGLESDIGVFETQLTGQVPAEQRDQTTRVVLWTLGGLAFAGGVLWVANWVSKTWWVGKKRRRR